MADFEEEKKPIGPLLDELGMTVPLEPEERIIQVLVIAKTVNLETGYVALTLSSNDLDWIEQWGLHSAAGQVYMCNSPTRTVDED